MNHSDTNLYTSANESTARSFGEWLICAFNGANEYLFALLGYFGF